jgi:hypothetical protein
MQSFHNISRLSRLPLIFLATVFFTSCAGLPLTNHKGVTHVVVVWLKRHGNADDQSKLIAAAKSLKSIDGVRSVDVGTMLPSKRPIVDSTYDVAVVFRFSDEKSLRAYEKNPVHLRVVKEVLKPLSSKLLIYDFVEK